MPFPWEQALQVGVSLGVQQAQRSKASGNQKEEINNAFNTLNNQLAAHLNQYTNQATVTLEQLNQAASAYGQLEGFAQQYGNVEYVARQWRDEQPRYQQWFQWLTTKLPGVNTTAVAAPVSDSTGSASGNANSAPLIGGISNTVLALIGIGVLVLFLKR